MALVAKNPNPPHCGVFLPPKPHTAEAFWNDYNSRHKGSEELPDDVKEYYNRHAAGGQQSFSDRTVKIYSENGNDCLAIGAKVSTTVTDVRDMMAMWLQVDPNTLTVKRKTAGGGQVQKLSEEVASTIFIGGVKSFSKPTRQYEHPFLIVGAGLGGIQCMMDLGLKGRKDIVCMDRNEDFGGHSWIKVPNKFTKLQTERATYNVDYILPWAPVPQAIGNLDYKIWPSRDLLLAMMREGAKTHGLYEFTRFSTHIVKVTKKGDVFVSQYVPAQEDGDADVLLSSAVSCWPGFLHDPNRVEFVGEDDFGGYIEYSSFDKVDYDLTTGKVCILYGHGAFTIENVRTLCEHRAKKVWVVCRTRNLSGTKMASWLVGALPRPLPALCLLDAFKRMYDLVGYDVWSSPAVKTDSERSFAQIEQKTIFGVTDIYFLAGYFGLMEVLVTEVKRLSAQTCHLKTGKKLFCECFIKAIGTAPSFKVDREMGIKEVSGFWVNGDPMRPISLGNKGVQAKNFGSFSVGPGFAPMVKILNYFLDYPDDFWLVKDRLPTNKAGIWPAFVVNASYGLPCFMVLQTTLPVLAGQLGEMDSLKARKQNESLPLNMYLGQCKKEWETYIDFFRKHNLVDDRPDPAYPYTEEVIQYLVAKADRIHNGEKVTAD